MSLCLHPLKTGSVRFDRVTFRYAGNERAALRDFSLNVPAGEIVAIVGENGAGKTTLIKLLCRLYDPDAGRIEIDGSICGKCGFVICGN